MNVRSLRGLPRERIGVVVVLTPSLVSLTSLGEELDNAARFWGKTVVMMGNSDGNCDHKHQNGCKERHACSMGLHEWELYMAGSECLEEGHRSHSFASTKSEARHHAICFLQDAIAKGSLAP